MLNINASIKTRFNRCHHSGDILKMILMRPEKVIPMKPESVIPSYQKMRSRWARICNELGKLAQSFHSQYLDWDFRDLIDEFTSTTERTLLLVESLDNSDLYGH